MQKPDRHSKRRQSDSAPSDHAALQELERALLHGLGCEWESACAVLPATVAQALRRPSFRLAPLISSWGHWSPHKREIVVRRRLVLDYPWDSVREVLLHEIAHQVAEQALGGGGQAPHGAAFQRACRMLGANPRASGDYVPLEDRIQRREMDRLDARMNRIDKLMALAQSSHRHEAEAAMLKAHELIAKYNVDRIAGGGPSRFVSAFAGAPALRHPRDAYHLANLLQDCYFVSGIWVAAYVLEKGKMGRVLEISGTHKNVSIARHVHAVLERTIRGEWQRFQLLQQTPARARVDFAIGIVSGFREKLENQYRAASDPTPHALVRIEDPELTRYVVRRYPYTRTVRGGALRPHAGVRAAGARIGRDLVISKAIEERGRSKRLLPR